MKITPMISYDKTEFADIEITVQYTMFGNKRDVDEWHVMIHIKSCSDAFTILNKDMAIYEF